METIIRFISMLPFVKKLWDAVDGWKTYLAAVGLMLTGLAGLLGGLAGLIRELTFLANFAAIFAWSQTLIHDTYAQAVLAGWAMFLVGLRNLGQRHALDKAAEAGDGPIITVPVPEAPAAIDTAAK